jgi:hypothetical protein
MPNTSIHISDFKNSFNGGTRQNRFMVEGVIPFNGGSVTRFHIKTTQIPAVSTQSISFDYFGRKANYPGEVTYGPWAMIVIDDTGSGNLWRSFQNWQNGINNHSTNESFVLNSVSTYKASSWTIHHLNINGTEATPLKKFILHDLWPRTVEPITFNMANPNTLSQFAVTLLYDWIEIENITS